MDERKILICHYRTGGTDGVSLEIDKRRDVLKTMGYEVALMDGTAGENADFVIPELDFDHPWARNIAVNAFGGLKEWNSEEEFLGTVNRFAEIIRRKVVKVIKEWKPGFLLLHNIFSHGRHIAAARGFYLALKETGVKGLATHHDFYWERNDFRNPSGPVVEEFLAVHVPPRLDGLRHAVINSLAAESLLDRRGISAMIIPDTLDFTLSPWGKDDYNRDLLPDCNLRERDILVLQATRIVPRKGIELIPPILKRLNSPKYISRLRGKTLYNGKKVEEDSRFLFILAGFAEGEALEYEQKLELFLKKEGVSFRFIRSRIGAFRSEEDGTKLYSLFDTYPYADIVSYPSFFEGWGNQFIEAVFARKPIMLFEYPVYKADIKHKGYEVISMGDETVYNGETDFHTLPEEVVDRVCEEILEALVSPDTPKKLERNFNLAARNNSYGYLQALLKRGMEHWDDTRSDVKDPGFLT